MLRLPLLEALVPGGVTPGSILAVEFEPHSPWYEASQTLAAQAVAKGIRTDYHVFQRTPQDVFRALRRLGVSATAAGRGRRLRVIDSFTAQTGLGEPKHQDPYAFASLSLRLSDWKTGALGVLREAGERDLLHIDDNDSALATVNSEDEILDFFRTRSFAAGRDRRITFLHGFATGVHSRRFYRNLETLVDGVFDFASKERGGAIEHLARVRMLRGRTCDTRWRPLQVSSTGEVSVRAAPAREGPRQRTRADRQLVAIMFTDVVGFTTLAQRNEARALALVREGQLLARPCFEKYGGREVKSLGDGSLVVFPSAVESVRCALDLQRRIARRNRAALRKPALLLRVGIHLGDVVEEGDDVVGDAVNVASRLEPLAEPGGICVSGQLLDQVRNKVPLSATPVDRPTLKHVEAPIEVFRIRTPVRR